jgi:diaminohydroxyphosphoribosylaminopyrimidine deaminase/5-amino-6-(5-phosphoribosylamino)uracil reductase
LALAARELNIGFFSRHERGRPWLRLKVATTLDGRTSLPDGSSQWITGVQARTDGHEWRRRAGAVLTGIGTALADDPRLDVRLVATTVQPLRVVVDSALRLPVTSRLLAAPGHAMVVGARSECPAAQALRQAGAEVWACPGADTKVDLAGVLRELGRRGINEVHVEAGPRLNGAWIGAGLVDELLVYMAPSLLGPGLGFVDWPRLPALAAAPRFRIVQATLVGEDLRLRLRPAPHGEGIPPVENFDILAAHLPKPSTTC